MFKSDGLLGHVRGLVTGDHPHLPYPCAEGHVVTRPADGLVDLEAPQHCRLRQCHPSIALPP